MNRDQARELFNSKRDYSAIGSREIATLRYRIINELENYRNNGFRMVLLNSMDVKYSPDGNVVNCSFRVQGRIQGDSVGNPRNEIVVFESREAITFNTDGFIGFAGWADGRNVQPFLKAFEKWIEKDFEEPSEAIFSKEQLHASMISADEIYEAMEGKTKSITFDKAAQVALPQDIKDKMKADREKALAEVGRATVRQKFQELKDEFAMEQGHQDWGNYEYDEGWEFNTPVLDEIMQRTWTAALENAIQKFQKQQELCATLKDRIYLDGVLAVLDSLKLTQKS